MIKNFRTALARATAAGFVLGLAATATPTPAGATPSDTVLLGQGGHVPGTMLPRAEAAGCPLPATADDSVLVTVKRVLDQYAASAKVRLATFEAAWTESHANNLNCGDADSVGVFQQRPSTGWGTTAQIRNVANATRNFLNGNPSDSTPGAIDLARDHPDWSAGNVAQGVQHSKYPSRYDDNRTTAEQLIKRASTLDTVDLGLSGVALPQGGLAVFTRNNSNGRLSCRYRSANGTWTDWIDRDTGILGSGPDATSRTVGSYDVVARRTDGTVIIKSKTNTGWGSWRVLADGLTTNYAPAIVTYNTTTIYVFAVRATDGALMSVRWHQGNGYGPWRPAGDNTGLTSGPDAVKTGSGALAVAFRGPTGNIRIARWTSGRGWSAAVNWGAPAAGTKAGVAPALASRSATSLDLMVQDPGGRLHRKIDSPSASWTAPQLPRVNQGPDLITPTSTSIRLFARNTNGTPVTVSWQAGKGWASVRTL